MRTEASEKERAQGRSSGSAGNAGAETSGRAEELFSRFTERQGRELAFYLAMAIIFVELLITLVALCYGIVTAKAPPGGGMPRFNFPWIPYFISLAVGPAALLLMVHLTGVGLLRSLRGHEEDEAWREKLPERIRRAYSLVRGAPTVVLLLGVVFLGALLFFAEGALNALFRLGESIERHLPWILGAAAFVACVNVAARAWFRHRSDRIAEEYAFRREVLEKTGIVIVDKGSIPLLPGESARPEALPPGDGEDGSLVDITPPFSASPPSAPDGPERREPGGNGRTE
jgi:uncharacterized RDD family membrane protein YckC